MVENIIEIKLIPGCSYHLIPKPELSYAESDTVCEEIYLGKLYVHLLKDKNCNLAEVHCWIGKGGSEINGLVKALGWLISLCLRAGIPQEMIIEGFNQIKAENLPGTCKVFFKSKNNKKGRFLTSIPQALAYLIEGWRPEVDGEEIPSLPIIEGKDL
jgi:hypothetical protein